MLATAVRSMHGSGEAFAAALAETSSAFGWFVAALVAALAVGLGAAGWAVQRARRDAKNLRQALLRRDEQLAHTAHELRTPLASILTALELVREGYARTAAETEEFLGEADLAARHLAFLVNDVLDEAALGAGRLRLSIGVHRVRDLVSQAIAVLGLQARKRDVLLRTGDDFGELAVAADQRRLLQVLFNLVGNAVKFSAPQQPVQLEVEARGDRVRFRVLDDGPGVPQELRPHLFTPFAAGAADRRTEGTGLGLHVTKRIVEQMHGTIGYEPRQPRGSEFWVDLPRADAASATPAVASAGEAAR